MWQTDLKHNALNKCKTLLLYLNKNTSKIKDLTCCTAGSFWTAPGKPWLGSCLLLRWPMHLQPGPGRPPGELLRTQRPQPLTLHHFQSSLKTFIKRGQTLPQSLFAARTWKPPNFHLQFLRYCDVFFISGLSSASNSFRVFSLPVQRTSSDWKS